MKRVWLILAASLMMLAPISASAAIRGHVFIGGGWGGGWYGGPYWGYGWGPYGYWGPGYYYAPNAGHVKLDTKVKDAQVYLNGAYAGTTKEDKNMYLHAGTYNLDIREGGHSMFAQQIYVTPGRTLHIHPELEGRS
jgi:PEGA domain